MSDEWQIIGVLALALLVFGTGLVRPDPTVLVLAVAVFLWSVCLAGISTTNNTVNNLGDKQEEMEKNWANFTNRLWDVERRVNNLEAKKKGARK